MLRILLVRHGETELQSSLRYWGKTDVDLAESGLRQAELLAERLSEEKIDHAYSSNLKRASVTAGIIAARHKLVVTAHSELGEIDFGRIEGLTYPEIQAHWPDIARMWVSRDENLIYPGGESLIDLEKRVAKFVLGLNGEAGISLVVAHAGVLRSLICQLLGLDSKHRWNLRLDLASLSIIEIFPEVNILNLLNDTSHLKDGPS
jgi:alpha-ribazole phosphatase